MPKSTYHHMISQSVQMPSSKTPPLYGQLLPLPTPCFKMFWKIIIMHTFTFKSPETLTRTVAPLKVKYFVTVSYFAL